MFRRGHGVFPRKPIVTRLNWGHDKPQPDYLCLRLRFTDPVWLVWTCKADYGDFHADYVSSWTSTWGTSNDSYDPLHLARLADGETVVSEGLRDGVESFIADETGLGIPTASVRASELMDLLHLRLELDRDIYLYWQMRGEVDMNACFGFPWSSSWRVGVLTSSLSAADLVTIHSRIEREVSGPHRLRLFNAVNMRDRLETRRVKAQRVKLEAIRADLVKGLYSLPAVTMAPFASRAA